jgi:hypothetical protein
MRWNLRDKRRQELYVKVHNQIQTKMEFKTKDVVLVADPSFLNIFNPLININN